MLTDRVAIVTGAGNGIGLAVCRRLLREGARVVAVDIDGVALDRRDDFGDGEIVMVEGDVADPHLAQRAVAAAVGRWGGVDIMVNNAAIATYKPWLEVTVEEWRRTLEVNLSAYFYWAREVAPMMIRRGAGRIINMASVNSVAAEADVVPYVASKGGVAGLTRALAVDLGPHGVTVNAIAPGATEHQRNAAAFLQPVHKAKVDRIPLGRTGRPTDIANLVAWLASDESGYINGETIVIDGGLTVRI